MSKERKHYTPEEKVAILRRHLLDKVPVRVTSGNRGKPEPPPDDPGNPTINSRGEQRSNQTHE